MAEALDPRQHWPQVLQLALGVGTRRESPFSRALAEVASLWSLRAGVELWRSHGAVDDIPQLQEALARIGFPCTQLSSRAVLALFAAKERLLAGWGRAEMLESLGRIYLGEGRLLRGKDFASTRIVRTRKLNRFRLADREATNEVVTYLLAQRGQDAARIAEFCRAAANLLPSSVRMEVKEPASEPVDSPPRRERLVRAPLRKERIA